MAPTDDPVATDDAAPATSYFRPDGDRLVPTRRTRGPWGEWMGGGSVGGLLAHAAERAVDDPELVPARLTVDLLRPVALEPVVLRTDIVRQGRRLVLVDAQVVQNDVVVSRASVLYLRPSQQPPDPVWTTDVAMPPLPTAEQQANLGSGRASWAYGSGAAAAPPTPAWPSGATSGPSSRGTGMPPR